MRKLMFGLLLLVSAAACKKEDKNPAEGIPKNNLLLRRYINVKLQDNGQNLLGRNNVYHPDSIWMAQWQGTDTSRIFTFLPDTVNNLLEIVYFHKYGDKESEILDEAFDKTIYIMFSSSDMDTLHVLKNTTDLIVVSYNGQTKSAPAIHSQPLEFVIEK